MVGSAEDAAVSTEVDELHVLLGEVSKLMSTQLAHKLYMSMLVLDRLLH